MPLDARSVVDLLLEHGAIEPGDVLDRELTVTDLSRRNANFAVRRRGAPGLFVKQAGSDDPLNAITLDVEASVARAAGSDPAFAHIAALAPPLRLFDPERRVLVVGLVEGAEDLQRRSLRDGGVAPEIARAVGEAVGALHAAVPVSAQAGAPGPSQAWILSLPLMDDGQLPSGRPGLVALRDVAREDRDLEQGLRELRESWRTDAFLHGDLKWENVLVVDDAEGVRVQLVDWEIAGFGDAAWDAGGLLHSFLRDWVAALPPDALAAGAATDAAFLEAMAPSIDALWRGYCSAASPPDPDALLERAVRCAGARLLQTAFESVSESVGLTGHTVGLAQLAANVVARPRAAAAALFGLGADG